MIGDHGASVIADAWVKGVRGFDGEAALRALVKNATETPSYAEYADGKGRRALAESLSLGYIPLEQEVNEAFHKREQVSRTLEYAYDDFAIAALARALGREDVAAAFTKRAANWQNVFDRSVGFVRRTARGRPVGRDVRPRGGAAVDHRGHAVAVHVLRPPRRGRPDRGRGWARGLRRAARSPLRRGALLARERAVAPHRLSLRPRRRALADAGGGAPGPGQRVRPGPDGAAGATTTPARCRPGTSSRRSASTPSPPALPHYEIGSPLFEEARIDVGGGRTIHRAGAGGVRLEPLRPVGDPRRPAPRAALDRPRGRGPGHDARAADGPAPEPEWGARPEDAPPSLSSQRHEPGPAGSPVRGRRRRRNASSSSARRGAVSWPTPAPDPLTVTGSADLLRLSLRVSRQPALLRR